MLGELDRLLKERGEDAVRLWPEGSGPTARAAMTSASTRRTWRASSRRSSRCCSSVYARRNGGGAGARGGGASSLSWWARRRPPPQASFARVLRTEEVRFREAAVMESVLHHVDVGILVAELDGTLSFATPPVARLIGVPVRSLVGAQARARCAAHAPQLNARHPGGAPFRVTDMPFMRAAARADSGARRVDAHRPARRRAAMLEMCATPLWEEGAEGELAGVIQTMSGPHRERARRRRSW